MTPKKLAVAGCFWQGDPHEKRHPDPVDRAGSFPGRLQTKTRGGRERKGNFRFRNHPREWMKERTEVYRESTAKQRELATFQDSFRSAGKEKENG